MYTSTIKKLATTDGGVEIYRVKYWKVDDEGEQMWMDGDELPIIKNRLQVLAAKKGKKVAGGRVNFRTPIGWRSMRWVEIHGSAMTSDPDVPDPDKYNKIVQAVFEIALQPI